MAKPVNKPSGKKFDKFAFEKGSTTTVRKAGVTPGGRRYDATRKTVDGKTSKSTYVGTDSGGYHSTEYTKETKSGSKPVKTKSSGILGGNNEKNVGKGPTKAMPGFGKKTAKKKK
jgi:hypothetical protein